MVRRWRLVRGGFFGVRAAGQGGNRVCKYVGTLKTYLTFQLGGCIIQKKDNKRGKDVKTHAGG